jgi:hypothetical protein
VIRVARWFIFIPKNRILVCFGRPWDGNFRCIAWPFGIFVAILVYISHFSLFYQEKSGNPEGDGDDGLNVPNIQMPRLKKTHLFQLPIRAFRRKKLSLKHYNSKLGRSAFVLWPFSTGPCQ